MNIVQISEQLKDVPDQFLMQEVQNPTGSYPSYLVVSELTRRKRMREGAIKQEPTTSVAEDLVGISATPQAAQSTLGAAQQMMAQPQQMPQQMPEMGMNQPQMGTPMMAGGGLVAFEQGGPIRGQEGMYTGDYRPSAFERFLGFNLFQAPEGAPTGEEARDLTMAERQAVVPSAISRLFPDDTERMLRISEQNQRNAIAEQTRPYAGPADVGYVPPDKKSPVATGEPSAQQKAAGEAPPPKGGGLGAFKLPAYPTEPANLASQLKSLSEEDRLAARAAGMAEREKLAPDRTSKLLEERILRKTEQLQKDKDMTFNEALFAAGAAVLSAPGGGGMKWAGEGLKAFGQTLAEGKKDMRRSQDLLDQANIDLANAQMLRDQGNIDAADKAEQKAQDRIDRSNALLTTQASLARQGWLDKIAAAKAPYEMAELQGKAGYYGAYADLLRSGGAGAATAAAKAGMEGIDVGKMTQAKIQAQQDLASAGNKNPTETEIIERAALYYPAIRNIPTVQPKIRGLEAPATLAPGT